MSATVGGAFGVCLVTRGPGAIRALNGLYDAKLDGRPVVAILGQQARTVLGDSYYQEIGRALWHGDPDRVGVIRQAFRQMLGG